MGYNRGAGPHPGLLPSEGRVNRNRSFLDLQLASGWF